LAGRSSGADQPASRASASAAAVPKGDPLVGTATPRHVTRTSSRPTTGPYPDDWTDDDAYWAAAELWLATGAQLHRRDVLSSPQHAADAFDRAGFDFHRVTAPARLDMALAGARGG
jgi:hypothetical protein